MVQQGGGTPPSSCAHVYMCDPMLTRLSRASRPQSSKSAAALCRSTSTRARELTLYIDNAYRCAGRRPQEQEQHRPQPFWHILSQRETHVSHYHEAGNCPMVRATKQPMKPSERHGWSPERPDIPANATAAAGVRLDVTREHGAPDAAGR